MWVWLCDYSDTYILAKGTITFVLQGANDGAIASIEIINKQHLKSVHHLLAV